MADPVALLKDLLRFNTVNPPGDERVAQEHLAGMLEGAGFEVDLLGRTPERPNLVARLPGTGDGPTLCLLSHVDTVLANPSEWTQDPWGGDEVDGVVYGRGAQDMKQQTATEVCAALRLAAEGWRGKGDLLVVCVVDEETGGAEGAKWICENHPDKVRADYLLNEGAGTLTPFGDERLYPVCIAEKGVFRFRLRTSGVAAHASMPRLGDNALIKLAPLLERMRERQPSFDITEGPRLLLERLGLSYEELCERDAALARVVEPMLGVTLAPTMASGSSKINVIPSSAELEVDCRVPPGLGAEEAERRVREVLGEDGYELEFTEMVVGNGSPADTPLWDAMAAWMDREDAGCRLVPTILPGFTDSRTWRAAFPDIVAYGFFPQKEMTLYEVGPLWHGADERIDKRDLEFATRFFADMAREICG
ncbi:MAG: family metallo-hydrolase [Solirubrobacterales bacterium]|nr:family metallo-hydrolase [Solirubrobacterales bacterium]